MKPGLAFALAVAGLTVLALALRLPALGRSLWYDELFTYQTFIADRALWQCLWTYRAANNHPLYSACARIALALPLRLELALRLPALILGLALVPALAALGRRLASPRVGLIAAALVAIAPGAILYAQEARGYSGAALAITLFFAAISLPTRDRRRLIAIPLTIILTIIAAAGFHPAAALITLAAALPWLRAPAAEAEAEDEAEAARGRRLRWLAWGGGHILLFLLALPVLKRVLSFARRNVLTNSALPWEPGARLLGMVRAWSSWDGLPWSALILLPLALLGLAEARRRGGAARALAAVFLAASAASLLFWSAPRTLFYPRFILPLQPVFLLLAALGLDALAGRLRRGGPAVIAAALVLLAALHLAPWRRWSGPDSQLQDLSGACALAEDWAGEQGTIAAGGIGGELMEGVIRRPVVLITGPEQLLQELRRPVIYIEPFAGSSIGPIDRLLEGAEEKVLLSGRRAAVAVYRLEAR